jgi:hypothetical protein
MFARRYHFCEISGHGTRNGHDRDDRSSSMKSKIAAIGLALSAVASPAVATEFCHLAPARLCDGCTATEYWYVTSAKVPRPRLMGGKKVSEWCHIGWSSLGGQNRFELLAPPKNGKLELGSYWLRYRSEKVGHDRFTLRQFWQDRSGKRLSGVVTYEIEVVDRPL